MPLFLQNTFLALLSYFQGIKSKANKCFVMTSNLPNISFTDLSFKFQFCNYRELCVETRPSSFPPLLK